MAKIGRNDPCYCGSGKKYKQCHGPIDQAQATAQRLIRQAPDTLLPKLFDAVPRFADELPQALRRFWNDKYQVQTVEQLDEHEDRGSERFLTWFLFDYAPEGQTPYQRLAADPSDLELTDAEQQVFSRWAEVRLQPYVIESVTKGEGFTVRPFFGEQLLQVEDHAAAKRVEAGEIVIVHLIPVVEETHFITGAAAQISAETVTALREFTDLHLSDLQRTQPEATYDDLIRTRSDIFNHFIMALPRDEKEMTKLDELVASTKAMLSAMTGSLGFGKEDAPGLAVPQVEADAEAEEDAPEASADTAATEAAERPE